MMKIFKISVTGMVTLLFLTACGHLIKPNLSTKIVNLKAGNYVVDPLHTTVLFKIDHLGLSRFIGRFDEFNATLDFDPNHLEQSTLSAAVDMSSVDVNSQRLEKTIKGRGWLNVDKFPYAHFETDSAKLIDEQSAIFTGVMTFLGKSMPLDIQVKFNGGGFNVLTTKYTIGFEASTEFSRSQYGLDKFIPAIGDKVELEIHTEFKRL